MSLLSPGLSAAFQTASVILPASNEAANIVDLVRDILASQRRCGLSLQVIVVDDDSPDRTAGLVEEAFHLDPRVKLVVRRAERGLATAIRRGVEEAANQVLLFMDADYSHHPRYLPQILGLLASCRISVGSRYLKGGGMNTSRTRWVLSHLFNLLVRGILGAGTRDSLSSYMAIRTADQKLFDWDVVFHGYGDYPIRLFYLAQRRELRTKELPVVYEERQGVESKTAFLRTFILYFKPTLAARRLK